MTTAEAVAAVTGARSAAELFAGDSPARVYRRLARLLHPDLCAEPSAEEAFSRLATLWAVHNHGQMITTRLGSYRVGPPLHRGGTAMLYPANDDLLLKVPVDPADNHLARREAQALRTIAAEGDPVLLPYVPRVVETFRHRSASRERQATVLSRAGGGFVTLAEIIRRRPEGLDPRDAAWIWRRLLVAVGLAHRAGVTHGAILPRHVLVHPIEHGLILVDWCRSGSSSQPGSEPGSASGSASGDVGNATRCVAELIGDHPVPHSMRAFLRGCALRPPQDAWALLSELDELLDHLYGPRQYRPLHL